MLTLKELDLIEIALKCQKIKLNVFMLVLVTFL